MMARKGTGVLTARGRAMQRLLARWEQSGLSLAEFAARRPAAGDARVVAAHAGGGRADAWGRAIPRAAELPVRSALAEAARPAPATFEVVFGDGTVVRVPVAFDAEALDRLLALVVGRGRC